MIVLALLGCANQTRAQNSFDKITIYTEHNPPFNFHEEGELKGSSVDILLEIFKRLNIDKSEKDMIISPWARAYSETQRRPNTMLFATVRTPMREKLFKWVGPISSTQIVLLAKANHDINLQQGGNINAYKYGASHDSRGEQMLLEAGVHPSRFIHVNSHASAVTMLSRGRFDAWVRDITVARWTIMKLGFDIKDFSVAYSFDVNYHYFAFHKETDEVVIKAMQAVLDELKEDGTLLAINQKYQGTSMAAVQGLSSKTIKSSPHVVLPSN